MRIATDTLNPSIRLSLQNQKPLCRVYIAWADGNARVYKFYIEISTDGQNWQSAFNGKSSGSTTDYEPYPFNGKQAKYVRVTVTDSVWALQLEIAKHRYRR
jgi:hypothetical protein